jgi:hypothetical protein
MEVVVIAGGLGNQMFQYAFYLAKKRYNDAVVINDYWVCRNNDHSGYELDKLFGISACQDFFVRNMVRIIRKLLIFNREKGFRKISSFLLSFINGCGIRIIIEKNQGTFNDDMLVKRKGLCFYVGYWQTEAYFLSIKNDILNTFSFDKTKISHRTFDILDLIENTNSISIHVRRGDFLSEENREKCGNICTPDYYNRAITEMEKQVESPVFFVFSDDIEWTKENISVPFPHYIDWNRGEDSWQDMFLMSRCKHNIIANSTFSWWGGWLNPSPHKIVIAPERIFNDTSTPDFIPENWIKI